MDLHYADVDVLYVHTYVRNYSLPRLSRLVQASGLVVAAKGARRGQRAQNFGSGFPIQAQVQVRVRVRVRARGDAASRSDRSTHRVGDVLLTTG